MNMQTALKINSLELNVHLGWPEVERKQSQIVLLDIDIRFSETPKACESDDLKDSFCYDELCQKIRSDVAEKSFRLIEHLSAHIYSLIKPFLPEDVSLAIQLTKHPKVDGLRGDVSFVCGDNI